MRIGIIGAGTVGSTLSRLFIRDGHDVILSHDGAPEDLEDLVALLGEHASATTPEDAARLCDIAVLAIPFVSYRELPRDAFSGKITIDATNYYPRRDGRFREIDEGLVTSSELIARHLDEARLVKALNSLPMPVLEERARPRGASDRLASPVSGDYPEAKRVVGRLIDEIGYDAVDLGGLIEGGRLYQQRGPLYLKVYSAQELLAALGLEDQPIA